MAGLKTVENRSWRTKHRGPLVIHAAAACDPLPLALDDGTRLPDPSELAYGTVLGSVDLVDCVPVEEAPDTPFTLGPWCWLLANPRPLSEPIPHPGQVGLWTARVESTCDHCQKTQPVQLGVDRHRCIRCGKWFVVEW